MPNLIVFLFNHLYFVFYMGFYCMGCVWEKVWRLKRLLKIKWISREVSWQAFPRSLYPHYPHIGRSAFLGENLRYYPWELEIYIPTILYTILCGFPQLRPLHIQILERLIAQTLTTSILGVKWGFGSAGKHWKNPFVWWMQSGWIAWSGELEKTRLRQVNW